MLAYKAWRESQARFIISAAALAWFCSLFVLVRSGVREAVEKPYADFVVNNIYTGGLRNLFVVLVLVLGLGGLLQEAARGTAAFTLSLPVRRMRLVAARAAVGLAEVAGLAAMPTLAVWALSPVVHESYSVGEALRYSAQWAACGAVLFAATFLLSVLLSGPYAALATSIASLFGYALLFNTQAARQFPSLNVFHIMSASHATMLTLCAALLAAVVIVAGAAYITEQQDF